jgi:hypothetical protein
MFELSVSGIKVNQEHLTRLLLALGIPFQITRTAIIRTYNTYGMRPVIIAKRIIILLAIIAVSMSATACSFGGHSVDVTVGNNGCSHAPCTSQPIKTHIDIR